MVVLASQKDVKALKKIAEINDYTAKLISAVEEVNDAQKLVITKKIIERFGENLEGFTFAIWGCHLNQKLMI